jgi:hypothetical protein
MNDDAQNHEREDDFYCSNIIKIIVVTRLLANWEP